MMIWLGEKAKTGSLIGKVEVGSIGIIVIFVKELSGWFVFGLNSSDVKTEGAEAIARFPFTQIALM